MARSTLASAKKAKNDVFYTQYNDVNNELCHYARHFKDKVVFCNCDDPEWSNFWKYFVENFENFGMKKLISTHYEPDSSPSFKMEYTGRSLNGQQIWVKSPLEGYGDFRSPECIELLKQSDIVVTNPPFSLFREYIAQLMEYEKKFVIIGNMNALTYKEVFPLIKDNLVWPEMHFNKTYAFGVPEGYDTSKSVSKDLDGRDTVRVPAITWYTNLDINKRHELFFQPEFAHAYYEGNEDRYPKYDNYDAINVDKTDYIPIDYTGVMGVPISFMDKYNPEEFEILDINPHFFAIVAQGLPKPKQLTLHNAGRQKDPYARILIRNRHPVSKADDRY